MSSQVPAVQTGALAERTPVVYRFAEFELDLGSYELRRSGTRCEVEPQVLEVLAYLVRERARLVSKDELLDAVWGHRFVSEATLTSRVMSARKALGDTGQEQRYIRTVRGRGYRFIGSAEEGAGSAALTVEPAPRGPAPPREAAGAVSAELVGRHRELTRIESCWGEVRSRRRKVLMICAEAGGGKTALAAAAASLVAREGGRAVHGQCVDLPGGGEPYLAFLDALARLLQAEGGAAAADVVARLAPSWLAQLPVAASHPRYAELAAAAAGATPHRMLRELASALETLTADRPLLLLLEDLHWADDSTMAAIAWLARRPEPAALFLIGTYRPEPGAPVAGLAEELRAHGQCELVTPPPLDTEATAELLRARLGRECAGGTGNGSSEPAVWDLADYVRRQTGGNPLFTRCVLDGWKADGLLRPDEGGLSRLAAAAAQREPVPDSLRALLERWRATLSGDELAVLEAAAAAGPQWPAALLVHAAERPAEAVEAVLNALSHRGGFVEALGEEEWPDGTLTSRYGFRHDAFRQLLYAAIAPPRRARLHLALGERLEAGWRHSERPRAAELARHFLQARDWNRAALYLADAGERALQRSAHGEAERYLRRGLELLPRIQDAPEAARRELRLLCLLAPALVALRGCGDSEARSCYQRALEVAAGLGPLDQPEFSALLYGLGTVYELSGDYLAAQQLMEQRLALPRTATDPRTIVETEELLACSRFHQGHFAAALQHTARALAAYQDGAHRTLNAEFGVNPAVSCIHWAALANWYLGHPETAVQHSERALHLALREDHSFCKAHSLIQAATLRQLRGEAVLAAALAEEAGALAQAGGYLHHLGSARILLGWARATGARAPDGNPGAAARLIENGLDTCRELGVTIDLPYFLGLLAEARLALGEPELALAALDTALAQVAASKGFFHTADLQRLRGEALAATGNEASAEASYHTALHLASEQGAPSLRLRAACSFGSFLHARGRGGQALALLEDALQQMPERPHLPDLARAERLLTALSDPPPPGGTPQR